MHVASEQPAEDMAPATRPATRLDSIRRFAFVAVVGVALLELLLHVVQTHRQIPESDWNRARDLVKAKVQPDDLILFSPGWVDPIGRRFFGDELITLEREARPDNDRFARAFEVSIRGSHAPEFKTWRRVGEERAGKVTVYTLENPLFVKVVDDLVAHAQAQSMRVSRVDGGRTEDCPWQNRGHVDSGNLGFGAAIPSQRASCGSGVLAAVTVVPVLDYSPRRCIYVPPPGGSAAARLVFPDVLFAKSLRGHHALYVEAERNKEGAPVTLQFSVQSGDATRILGKFTHNDGDGWKPFEMDTSDLAGQRAAVTVEVTAANNNRRSYCFEASTR